MSFKPGEYVLLKVSPLKGIKWLGNKGKISHWYISLFKVLNDVGSIDDRLALPLSKGLLDIRYINAQEIPYRWGLYY